MVSQDTPLNILEAISGEELNCVLAKQNEDSNILNQSSSQFSKTHIVIPINFAQYLQIIHPRTSRTRSSKKNTSRQKKT